MIAFLFLWALSAGTPPADNFASCQSAVEHKLRAKSFNFAVDRTTARSGWTILEGRFTVNVGPPPAGPGMGSPHHLIREDRQFICWNRAGRTRQVRIIGAS